jgi:hypothetical protein
MQNNKGKGLNGLDSPEKKKKNRRQKQKEKIRKRSGTNMKIKKDRIQ